MLFILNACSGGGKYFGSDEINFTIKKENQNINLDSP
jgi:hypothetical protein